ncbi:MAG: hypothetical protein ACTSYW_00500 [Candidatus Heimdallarchaeota archaeon]
MNFKGRKVTIKDIKKMTGHLNNVGGAYGVLTELEITDGDNLDQLDYLYSKMILLLNKIEDEINNPPFGA